MEGYKDSMKKKEKKRRPAKVKKKREHYEPLKPIFGKADDYQIYKMSLLEKLIGTGIGFGAGFQKSAGFSSDRCGYSHSGMQEISGISEKEEAEKSAFAV